MEMPGRKYTAQNYRYGFNGQEHDEEVFAGANTAEYWMYDTRLGRRWENDPLVYEWQSPYATFNNNPIFFSDPLGLEGEGSGEGGGDGDGNPKAPKGYHWEKGPKDKEGIYKMVLVKDPVDQSQSAAESRAPIEPIQAKLPEPPPLTDELKPVSPPATCPQEAMLTVYKPTFWDNLYATSQFVSERSFNFGPIMTYNVINSFYTGYNWIQNREPYDLRGVQVGYNRAVQDGVNLWVSILQLPIAGVVSEVYTASNISKGQIGITGKYGEETLSALGGESQVYFPTELGPGGRYIDRLVDGVAHESKVGYTTLTKKIKQQILKDAELIKSGEIKSSIWHFYKSPVTGKGNPSKPLKEFLREKGIGFIIHD